MLLITKSQELYCNFNVWFWAHDGAHTERGRGGGGGAVIAPFPHSESAQGWNLPPNQLRAFSLSALTLPTDAGWARSRRYLLKSGSVYFLRPSPSVLFEAAELLTPRLTFCAFKGILGSCRKPGGWSASRGLGRIRSHRRAGKKAPRAPLQRPARHLIGAMAGGDPRWDPSPPACTVRGDDGRWQMRSQKRIRFSPRLKAIPVGALFARSDEQRLNARIRAIQRCERRRQQRSAALGAALHVAETGAAPLGRTEREIPAGGDTENTAGEPGAPTAALRTNPRRCGADKHGAARRSVPIFLLSAARCRRSSPLPCLGIARALLHRRFVSYLPLYSALWPCCAPPRSGRVLPGLVVEALFPGRLPFLCKREENADFFSPYFLPKSINSR